VIDGQTDGVEGKNRGQNVEAEARPNTMLAEAEVYWLRLRPPDRGQYFGLDADAEAKG